MDCWGLFREIEGMQNVAGLPHRMLNGTYLILCGFGIHRSKEELCHKVVKTFFYFARMVEERREGNMNQEAIVKLTKEWIKKTTNASSLETKWMVLALYLRKEEDYFEIDIHDVYSYFSVDKDHRGGQQWQSIRLAIANVEQRSQGWIKSEIKENIVMTSFSEEAIKNLENAQIEVDLYSILKLKLKYSPKVLLRLYQELGQREFCDKNWALSGDGGIRMYLGVEHKYKYWTDFNKRVLTPTFMDIDTNCKKVKVYYQPYNSSMLKMQNYNLADSKSRKTIIGIRTNIQKLN